MARSRIPNARSVIDGNYIYHIEVDGLIYIGQSEAKGMTRLRQHINNVYLNQNNDDEETSRLYDRLRSYKLCDWKITIYDEASGFGLGT